jgi:hypothetical protein
MKKTILFFICFLAYFNGIAQISSLKKSDILAKLLTQDQKKKASITSLSLPNPESTKLEQLSFSDFTAMHPDLQAKFPDIKTYRAVKGDIEYLIQRNGTKLSITAKEDQHLWELHQEGGEFSTFERVEDPEMTAHCGTLDIEHNSKNFRNKANAVAFSNGSTLRTYRLAIVVTPELYQAFGSSTTATLARINAIVSSMNTIYLRELSIKLELIAASANLVFTNTATDPIPTITGSPDNTRTTFSNMATQGILANNAYDIGLMLHYSGILPIPASNTGGASGIAYLGVVCDPGFKSGQLTSFFYGSGSNEISINNFVASIVRHEIGHQFGANHTFSGTGGNCVENQRGIAVEAGSGNTIMSYKGICGANNNLSGASNDYFHIVSVTQMLDYIETISCGTNTSTDNAIPVVANLSDFSIPKDTPFTLIGTATDANNANLRYLWEQTDVAVANDYGALGTTVGTGMYSAKNSTTAPLFKSISASRGSRIFPSLSYILNSANVAPDLQGEALPSVSRTMDFAFIVKDQVATGGAYAYKEMTVTVDATTGPFAITYPNTNIEVIKGLAFKCNWNVNNTNTLSANVDIELSEDGGESFPIVLKSDTPNDGEEFVTVPTTRLNSTVARIRVKSKNSTNGYFFDLTDTNFKIVTSCSSADLTTTKSGDASDLTIYNCAKVPTATDKLLVATGHVLSLANNLTVLKVTNNGQIKLNGNILTTTEP